MSDIPTPSASDDDDERTTVVDRADAVLPADDEERTTVVDRAAAPEPSGSPEPLELQEPLDALEPLDDERTTVVDRGAAHDDDGTVVVSRSSGSDADPDADADHGETVIVARAHETAERPAVRSASRPSPSTGRRGRRRIALPPVEPGFGAAPVDAVGPGAVTAYAPRPIAPAPVAVDVPVLGADATRAPAPSMPSVGKRSRTVGIVAIGGFALACVVSVVGLVTIVVSILP